MDAAISGKGAGLILIYYNAIFDLYINYSVTRSFSIKLMKEQVTPASFLTLLC